MISSGQRQSRTWTIIFCKPDFALAEVKMHLRNATALSSLKKLKIGIKEVKQTTSGTVIKMRGIETTQSRRKKSDFAREFI